MSQFVRLCVILAALFSQITALGNYSLPFGPPGTPYIHRGAPFAPNPSYNQPQRPLYTPPTYLPPTPENGNPYAGQNYNDRNTYYDPYTNNVNRNYAPSTPRPPPPPPTKNIQYNPLPPQSSATPNPQGYPERPSGFTKVQGQGDRAQLHAVLDYDDDYYEDDTESGHHHSGQDSHVGNEGAGQPATPIQGPIFLKNGSVPVVPLYSYPVLNNGSFFQIPILWSALSVALGVEVRGQLIRGVPCVKRYHQLFCPTAGNTYPIDRIEHFIDENKALMKRMYGAFNVYTEYGLPARNRRDSPFFEDEHPESEKMREKRQTAGRGTTQAHAQPPFLTPQNQGNSSGRVDACESKMEIVTPYWALNSAGKVRAVVNTMHFEQAIHQEVCTKTQTNRCSGDCGCEQKYKWHRLLAYDPDQDCAGIFMDWFLFPSCCVCRCNP